MQIILGIVVYAYPIASTVGIRVTVASLLLIGVFAQLIQFFVLWSKLKNSLRLLRSIVMMVAGELMLRFTGQGMEVIAIADWAQDARRSSDCLLWYKG
ncbi:MAG: hypothetical protein NDI69_11150 [Bacteriovoracaceae bacterium]|nr:hypothetical protein [Bacteriovoracaceae bacterium]